MSVCVCMRDYVQHVCVCVCVCVSVCVCVCKCVCKCVCRSVYLGQQQQCSAGACVGMVISQVEEFGRKDGGSKKTQKEETTDGQILHILDREEEEEREREREREEEERERGYKGTNINGERDKKRSGRIKTEI